jgi:hypothetical protein
MKQYRIGRDSDTELIQVEVEERGTGYRLQHIPFHSKTGFELDSSRPGSADLAIAIVADWLQEHPTTESLKTQFWECLALSGDFHARFLAPVDGETCLILGNEIQVFMAGRSRYIIEREPSIDIITCDGC